MPVCISRILFTACAFGVFGSAFAADRVWTGASPTTPANWSDPINWSGGVVPTQGDRLFFPAGAPRKDSYNNFNPPRTFEGLVFSDPEGHVIWTSVTLTGSNPIVVEAASGTFRLAGDITLASANPAVAVSRPAGSTGGDGPVLELFGGTLNLGPGTTRFDAPGARIISRSPLVAPASAILVFSGPNIELTGKSTYAAGVRVEGGLLKVGGLTSLGATSAGTVVTGGRLSIGRFNNDEDQFGFDEPLDLRAPPEPLLGNVETTAYTLRGAIALTGTQTISGAYSLDGAISGTGGLRLKSPVGQAVTLTNAANSFTGGIEIADGQLTLYATGVIPDVNALTVAADARLNVGYFGGSPAVPTEETVRRLDCAGTIHFGTAGQARLRVLQASSVAGCRVFISTSSSLVPPDEMILLRNESGVPVGGTFANAPEGTTYTVNGAVMRLTYRGGSGNDISLVTVSGPPVPAALQVISGAPQARSTRGDPPQDWVLKAVDSRGLPVPNVRVRFDMPGCYWYSSGRSAEGFTDASGTIRYRPVADSRQTGICVCRAVVPGSDVGVDLPMHLYEYSEVTVVPMPSALATTANQPFSFGYELRHTSGMSMVGAKLYIGLVKPGAAGATLSQTELTAGLDSRITATGVANAFPGNYQIYTDGFGKQVSIPVVQSPQSGVPVAPLVQDMWWSGNAENGWGMSLVQHEEKLFAVIYAYDASGAPTWFVMSSGTWNEARTTYTGALYSPRGSPYFAYDASKFVVGAPVGSMSLTFADASRARLDYVINGVSGSKSITRQIFGTSGTSPGGAGDMWWGGVTQNGWGIAMLTQFSAQFVVWFTYDAQGAPTWFVVPTGTWSGPANYSARLYRTVGSPWVGAAYNPAALQVIDVGTFNIIYSSGEAGVEYVIDGRRGALTIRRQPF